MNWITVGLQLGAVVTAFIAAWFWFRSARRAAPPITWDGMGELEGWLNYTAKNSRLAATFAGTSAFLGTISILTGLS